VCPGGLAHCPGWFTSRAERGRRP